MGCLSAGSSTPTPVRRLARSRLSLRAQPVRSKVPRHGGSCGGANTKRRMRERRHHRLLTKQKAVLKFSRGQYLRLKRELRQRRRNRPQRRRLRRKPRQKPRKKHHRCRLEFHPSVLQRLASARTGSAITSRHSYWPDSIEMWAPKPSFLPIALNTTTR